MPYYLKSVFAVIICNAISNLLNLIIPTNQNVAPQTMTEEGFTELLNAISNNLGLVIGIISVFFLISLIFSLFVTNPLSVGQIRFFEETARDNSNIKETFFPFMHGIKNYFNIVKVKFVKSLIIALWGVPGGVLLGVWAYWILEYDVGTVAASFVGMLIIMITFILVLRKTLEYFFVEYILAEEPSLSWKNVGEMSRQMSNGQKISMFLLQISFFGWYILGLAFGGIGLIFVMPYTYMTFTQLYFNLKPNNDEDVHKNEEIIL